MLVLYSLALLLVLVVGSPWWLYRMATSGKYREGLSERLGRIPARIRTNLDNSPVVWIHAVSVGEVLAASRLIEELTGRGAGSGQSGSKGRWRVMISTTTRTGQNLARQRLGEDRVLYFPLDFAFAVRAWIRVLRPRMLILLETEFWPRMLVECQRSGVPVAVVNARISDRSWPRYRRLAFVWRRLLGGLSLVLAQSEVDAERLRALGAANVQIGGNLKYDVRSAEEAAVVGLLREHIPAVTPVLVCGSTLEEEEQMLLDAIPPGIVTILAPRHPERFDDVANLLRGRNEPWIRRSQWMNAPAALEPGTVFLLDSIGELASVYSLATVAFIGGSLVPAGGHNPLEPAQFGVPVMMGNHYENFRGIVNKLREGDAIRIVTADRLRPALAEMLSGSPAIEALGAQGREVFEAEAGATARAVDAVTALLGSQS